MSLQKQMQEILLHKIREEMTHDMAVTIREFETKLDEEKEKLVKKFFLLLLEKLLLTM